MTFIFTDLDPTTREYMLAELRSDLAGKGVYRSPRLSTAGWASYAPALEHAITSGDADTLVAALSAPGTLNATEAYSKGTRKVSSVAHVSLGEGEFNRYYIRGVCARVLAEGGSEVEVYRGRESGWHRPESDAIIGQRFDAAGLLADLRDNNLTPEDATVLPDVNSGLTVKTT